MYRHRLDTISLFFGLVFTAIGAALIFSDSSPHLFTGRWFWPALFVSGGVLLLAGLLPDRPAGDAAAIAGEADELDTSDFGSAE